MYQVKIRGFTEKPTVFQVPDDEIVDFCNDWGLDYHGVLPACEVYGEYSDDAFHIVHDIDLEE